MELEEGDGESTASEYIKLCEGGRGIQRVHRLAKYNWEIPVETLTIVLFF